MSTANRTPFEQCALASGLLTEEQLDEARTVVGWSDGDEPDANAPATDQQLADRLVEMGRLNAWQAKQLLDGRTKFNLGPYLIIDSIGQGGMGQIFKAEHGVMGRVVAIKVLPLSKSTPDAITSFTREIRALASLDHDKLVRALDAGHDGNVYYLVTEYVPGADLRKLVRRDGPLSMETAANIISQVAEGLAHAHAHELIHRDVKPGNVLVTPDGEAKLSDLGLAGPLGGDAETDPRFGKIVGTADYLSPDQVKSPWSPTPLWDIYSLGCTLYYAVTGKVPFPGGTTADKARAHCELRPLDPRRLNAGLSDEFVDVMADMMAKNPAERIPSAAEVIQRLTPWSSRPIPAPSGAGGEMPGEPLPPPLAARPALARPIVPPPVAGYRAIPPIRTAPPRRPVEPGVADTVPDSPPLPGQEPDDEDSSSLVVETTGPLIPAEPAGDAGPPAYPPDGDEWLSALRPVLLFVVAPLVLLTVAILAWWLLT